MLIIERPTVLSSHNICGWAKKQKFGKDAWLYRRELTLDVIKKPGTDLGGLQEVDLTNLQYYSENLRGYKIVAPDEISNGWYNPLFYNEDTLELLESGTIWLNPDDKPEPAWGGTEVRSATVGLFKRKQSPLIPAKNMLAVTTHYDNDNPYAWAESTKKILKTVSPYALPPYSCNIVIFGDINTRLKASNSIVPYSSIPSPLDLFHEAGYEEAYMATHPDLVRDQDPPPTYHGFPPGVHVHTGADYTPGHVDWIMVSEGFTPISCNIIYESPQKQPPFFCSDHFGKYAVLLDKKRDLVQQDLQLYA